MASWIESICYWLLDYYLAATVFLLVVGAVLSFLRQPARRVAVVWGGFVGLIILAVLYAVPGWPRFGVLPSISRAIAVAVSHDDSTSPAPNQSAVASDQITAAAKQQPRVSVEASPTKSSADASARRSDGDPKRGDQKSAAAPSAAQNGSEQKIAERPRREATGNLQRATAVSNAVSTIDEVRTTPSLTSAPAGSAWLPRASWLPLAGMLAFFAGCVVTLFRIFHGVLTARVLCKAGAAPPSTVVAELQNVVGRGQRVPRLLMSSIHPVPIATGAVRPTIILPWQFTENERTPDCRSVLAHEWAHIHNGDLWMLMIDRWLLPILWAHPVYLWLRRSIRNDQELLADALAAAHSNPVDYASMLLKWARRLAAEKKSLNVSTALGVWNRPLHLADRISKLVHQSQRVELRCSRAWRIGCVLLLAALPVFLSTATVRPAAPALMSASRTGSLPTPSAIEAGATAPVHVTTPSSDEAADLRKQWELEQPAVAAIRRLGGVVRTERFGNYRTEPIGNYRLVTEVNMVYGFTEDGRRVENTQFTDEALSHIAKLRNLKVLALAGPQVTDPSLRAIADLNRLERICLWDAQALSDLGMANIASLPRLKSLELTNAHISDASIERLSRIPTLQELSVQGSELSDKCIAMAARIPHLKKLLLDLGDRPVQGAALAELAHLPALEQLGVQSSALSDEALEGLYDLKNLRVLFLGDCRTTEDGLAGLRESLPNLYIVTAKQTYPALATGRSAAQCEATIRRSQEALALIRKLVKRVSSGNSSAAAQTFAPGADAQRQVALLKSLPASENVEWNLAYIDAKAVLAVSTEFSDADGAEHVIACTVKCNNCNWAIDRIGVAPARDGMDSTVREFAAAYPKANAANGWLPLPANSK